MSALSEATNDSAPALTAATDASDDAGNDSSDDALLEMLGLPSLAISTTTTPLPLPPQLSDLDALPTEQFQSLRESYNSTGLARLSTPALTPFLPTHASLLKITSEIIYSPLPTILRTHETTTTKVLTRLENFVTVHPTWTSICGSKGTLSTLLGRLFNTAPWPLYKEKLNLKPPGGKGFAPHLDHPSLAVTGLASSFVTVMLAIDAMTELNGCLEVTTGPWTAANAVTCEQPAGDNPDGDGRRGAIPPAVAKELEWTKIAADGAAVYIFSGHIPHKSNYNVSLLPRRAVFLTYNHPDEGDQRENYYESMLATRDGFKDKLKKVREEAARVEDDWLASVPK